MMWLGLLALNTILLGLFIAVRTLAMDVADLRADVDALADVARAHRGRAS